MDERRVRLGVVAIAAMVGIAAVTIGIRSYVGPALSWRAKLATLRALAQHQLRTIAGGAALAQANEELDAALISSTARVPAEAHLDDFVAEAGRTARAHHIRIVSFQPGDDTRERDARFLPVQIVVEGDFERIYTWMVELESGHRLVRVDCLRAASQTGATVRAEVRAQLFMRSNHDAIGG